MAGSAVQPAALDALAGRVLGTDRVVGTKRARLEHLGQVVLDVPALLHEAPQGAFRVGTADGDMGEAQLGQLFGKK